ncbi:MAG: NAD-dependent succinate-semialdehyde dehydrogenase [Dehalococcoidia bacterium]
MSVRSINPATEQVIATYEEFTPEQVEQALAETQAAFLTWRETTFDERARLMRRAAEVLRERKGRYGALMTAEMGKTIAEAEAEVEKCAWNCDFYAENAERFLADEPVQTNARESYVAYEPLGVILAVMPWNFPFWQVFRFAAPALMAGNTALLKHASNVSGSALAIEEVFRDAGFPTGAFRTLILPGAEVHKVIEDPRVRAVTLTGSDITGEKIAATSGRVLKKTVLELGGSDPFIVLADADLDAAAQTAARARFQNAGQSCIAAKRFIVEAPVASAFEQKFAEAVKALTVGDPTNRDTQVGPIARGDLREDLDRQVRRSVEQGARVVLGGHPKDGAGYFYEPAILADVTPEMACFREETFGPVAAVIRARDAEEAVALANDSDFGLGAALWTRDLDRARDLARRIESGSVFINGMVASDPRLPFGGVKRSGYGRELSAFGIREFVNVMTVWVGPATAPADARQKAAVAVE